MKKIIITGVTGFVGRHLAEEFAVRGYHVIGVSRSKPHMERIEWFKSDLGERGLGVLPKEYWDVPVVHCAALASDGKLSPAFTKANIQGTLNALQLAPDGRFIHISSSSIYDLSKPSQRLTEEEFSISKYKFYNGYGYTKAIAEQIVLQSKREIPAVTLRPHGIYGPGDTTLMPKIEKRIRNGKLMLPNGGNVYHSLTHVHNVVQAVLKVLEYTQTYAEAFNVTDAEPVLLRDALFQSLPHLEEIKNIPYLVAGAASIAGLVSKYEVAQIGFERTYDITKACELLGYAPTAFMPPVRPSAGF